MKKANLIYLSGFALCVSSVASAQGNPTGSSSDVGGANTTNSGIAGNTFAPSASNGATNPTLSSPQVQANVANAGNIIIAQLNSNTYTGGTTVSGGTLSLIGYVLSCGSVNSPSAQSLQTLLTTALGSGAAAGGIPSLMLSLSSLVCNPAQLPSAISAYNEVVANLTPAQVLATPAELTLIGNILTQLTQAAGGRQPSKP